MFEGTLHHSRERLSSESQSAVGLQYHPRKGDALMFFSMHPNGTFDKHALHGGCPVKRGEKIVMTKSAIPS